MAFAALLRSEAAGAQMATTGARQENPNLRDDVLWTPLDDQRCGVLIMGSRRADIFVATDVLLFAETLGAEEALRGWLAQHGVQMAPKEKIQMGQWGRDGVEKTAPESAKARHDGRKDER